MAAWNVAVMIVRADGITGAFPTQRMDPPQPTTIEDLMNRGFRLQGDTDWVEDDIRYTPARTVIVVTGYVTSCLTPVDTNRSFYKACETYRANPKVIGSYPSVYDWIAAVKLKGRSAAMVRKFAEANFNARKSPYARRQAEERAAVSDAEPPPANKNCESDESAASDDSRSAEEGDSEHSDDEQKPPVEADLA